MAEASTNGKDNRDRGVYFFGLFFGAFFAAFGGSQLIAAARPVEGIERTGMMIEATDSSGRFGNNTTLVFANRYGELESFKVRPSIRIRDVSRIRANARAIVGQQVIYTVDPAQEQLLSVRTIGWEEIVTREHQIGAKRFTGSGALAGGLSIMIFGLVCIARMERKKK